MTTITPKYEKELPFTLWPLYSKTFLFDTHIHTHTSKSAVYPWEKPKIIKEQNIQRWVNPLPPKWNPQNPTGTVKLLILQHHSSALSSAVLTCVVTKEAVLFFQLNAPLNATRAGLLEDIRCPRSRGALCSRGTNADAFQKKNVNNVISFTRTMRVHHKEAGHRIIWYGLFKIRKYLEQIKV